MKAGDRVKIIRKVEWEGWFPNMDSCVGKEGIFVGKTEVGYAEVRMRGEALTWFFPYSSLAPIDEENFDHLKWLEDVIHSGRYSIEVYRAGDGYRVSKIDHLGEKQQFYGGATLAQAIEAAASGKEYYK